MTRCHLNNKRICDSSCIAHDHRMGCRLRSNTLTPVMGLREETETLDLKEI